MSWLRARRVTERTRIASNALLRFSSLCRVGRRPLRPVLKHGPRSLTCMQAIGLTKPRGAVKAKSSLSARTYVRGAFIRSIPNDTCMQAIGLTKPRGTVKAKSSLSARTCLQQQHLCIRSLVNVPPLRKVVLFCSADRPSTCT